MDDFGVPPILGNFHMFQGAGICTYIYPKHGLNIQHRHVFRTWSIWVYKLKFGALTFASDRIDWDHVKVRRQNSRPGL